MTASRLLAVLPQVVLLLAVAGLAFLSGGYIFPRTAPIVFGLALGALAWIWVWRRRERPSLPYLVGLAAFVAFALWAGLSLVWSVGPDLSWLVFDATVFYLAVAWIAGLLPVGRAQLRVVGYGYVVIAAAVAAYAFLGKVLPEVVTHAHTYARLSEPIGYWNVLALTMVFGAVISLEGAARPDLPLAARGAAAGALVLDVFTLFFAFSRGGAIAFVLAMFVYFVLSNRRLSAAFTLAIVLGSVAAVLLRLRHLTTLFNPTADDALRTAQGHELGRWFLVTLAGVIAIQVLGALVQRRVHLRSPVRLAVGSAVIVALVAGVVVAGAVYFPRHGGLRSWVSSHYEALINDTGQQGAGASRLLAFGTNGRLELYREAVRGVRGHRLLGTGAGTFRFTHLEQRDSGGIVKHAHSQWFNVYSELGVPGLVLFAATIAGFVAAAFARLLRDRSDPDRALLAALQAAVVAFVFHMSVDWDWDMASATVAFLLFAATAAGYLRSRTAEEKEPVGAEEAGLGREDGGRERQARRLPLAAAVLATGLIVLGLASWMLPYLSERAYSAALSDAGRSRIPAALAAARRAHRLDPLAADPLIVIAKLLQQQGEGRQARTTLERALRLQPGNFEVYYQLGLLELNTFGRRAAAAAWFRKALALNPQDEMTRYQLSLAQGG